MLEVLCISGRYGFDIPAVGETYWVDENKILTRTESESSDIYVKVYYDKHEDSYAGLFKVCHFKIIDGYEAANRLTCLIFDHNKLSAELKNLEELVRNGDIGKSKIKFEILSNTEFESGVAIPISNDIIHPLMQSLRSDIVYTRDKIMGLMTMLLC